MADFVVRKSMESDIPSIYRLLQELVAAEKLVDVIALSEQGLNRDFRQGCFKAIVAEHPPSEEASDSVDVIGCALYTSSYSYFTGAALLLHGFYVRLDNVDGGIGRMLLQELKRIAADAGIISIAAYVKKDSYMDRALRAEGAQSYCDHLSIDIWTMRSSNVPPPAAISSDNYNIRQGNKGDEKAIYHLLRELVVFEDLVDDLVTTEEEFCAVNSSEWVYYKVFVLEYQSMKERQAEFVGCVIFIPTYHCLKGRVAFIQGLYVKPNHTGKGYGKALVSTGVEVLRSEGVNEFIIGILTDNKIPQSLFKSLNAVIPRDKTDPFIITI